MLLPGGITGFYDRDDKPLRFTDSATFRRHCHEAARCVGGCVVSVNTPDTSDVTRNFAIGTLALAGAEVAVLLNAHHPIVAFADPPGEGEDRLRFRDCPKLAEVFGSFGVYQVVPAAELDEALTPDSLAELSEIERQQVVYWEPTRVGDLAFNWWD